MNSLRRLEEGARMMTNLLSAACDFIFPRTSIISDERLEENNSNQYISDKEICSIPRVTSEDLSELKNKITAEDSFSVFAFRDGDDFSKIIYQLKYGGMKRLGVFLGRMLGEQLKNNPAFISGADLLIPVPLFKTKIRERGYNQSDYICRGINEILCTNYIDDVVTRTRYTITQTKLSREERLKNLKDAFEFNKKYKSEVCCKKIILVDDVVTTGATMNEVIKVLKQNQCGEIIACSLAMAR